MSEGMAVAAAVAPSPDHQSSRLEQRIRSLTEQIVQLRGELRRAEERIAVLTTVDEATGLFTARTFVERAVVEVERASRFERPLALAMLEPLEPVLLAGLAEVCRSQRRPVDVVGRGEDGAIALLLPEMGLPGALVVAERICAMARRRGVAARGGCAAWPANGGGLGRLTAAASQALAMARAEAGACVRSAPVGPAR